LTRFPDLLTCLFFKLYTDLTSLSLSLFHYLFLSVSPSFIYYTYVIIYSRYTRTRIIYTHTCIDNVINNDGEKIYIGVKAAAFNPCIDFEIHTRHCHRHPPFFSGTRRRLIAVKFIHIISPSQIDTYPLLRRTDTHTHTHQREFLLGLYLLSLRFY